jgi:hypothetical protein
VQAEEEEEEEENCEKDDGRAAEDVFSPAVVTARRVSLTPGPVLAACMRTSSSLHGTASSLGYEARFATTVHCTMVVRVL